MAIRTTAGKQRRGRPFGRGASGNPAGRPKGSRNRAAVIAEALSDADGVAIARVIVRKARAGDMVAARLVLDRLWPAPKGRMIEFEMPSVANASAIVSAHAALLKSVAKGALTPDEAQIVSGMLAVHLKTIEVVDIEQRLCALEERQAREQRQ